MKRVRLITPNINFSNEHPLLVKIVSRVCTDKIPPAKLYCNHIDISSNINRGLEEPIKFKSTRFVHQAALKFPGVSKLIQIEQIKRNNENGNELSLSFISRSSSWKGTFPSMYIPVGNYHKVWLIVQDEFDQQAKCFIGDITILP